MEIVRSDTLMIITTYTGQSHQTYYESKSKTNYPVTRMHFSQTLLNDCQLHCSLTDWVPQEAGSRGPSLESRIFSKMCPWDQHLWKGEEGSRNGNRGKASWDAGPVIVLVNPTGALE